MSKGNRGGRPPKPAALHKLEGTFNATRHRRRAHEPQADGELATMRPPARFSEQQQAIWRSVLGRAPKAVLRAIEHEAFTQYVDLLDRYERAVAAQAALDARQPDLPILVRGANGITMSPYVRIIDRTLAALLRLQSECGFTPVSRARLGEPEALPDPSDPGRWGELKHFPVIDGGRVRNGTKR